MQRSVTLVTAITLSAAGAAAQASAPGEPGPAAPSPAVAPEPLAPSEARLPPAPPGGTSAAPDSAGIATGKPAPASAAHESAPSAQAARELPTWLDHFSVGGGLILYYYQPTSGGGDNNFSVFFANLLLDGQWGNFGLHVEPRFRDTRLRTFFDGPAWLQEAYGSAALGPVTLEVGKIYKRLGLFWDNSFYGNVQVYDGLKLDPNYGVSLEGEVGDDIALEFSAQYFIVDGRSNVSLAGRDTLYVEGARRRDAFVGRLAPIYRFADEGSVQVGVSAERFTADLPGGEDDVTRVAGEAKVTFESFGAWAEVLVQHGRHVTDFPYAGAAAAPGRSSADNRYLLAGAEYGLGPVTLRYNVSHADYADVDVTELMHVPAIGVAANDNLGVLAEYVRWTRESNEGDSDVDESLNVTINGQF